MDKHDYIRIGSISRTKTVYGNDASRGKRSMKRNILEQGFLIAILVSEYCLSFLSRRMAIHRTEGKTLMLL
ncbi:hypothetical protein ARMSODRAFT_967296 [Armillaria solidipes]|uniref:Uncharacterized protein n=1 Tax=Armillaria solidipes TaxID=1076256 RepID=A0A2H3AJ28_9AGAR|nr:hypothetical protein ARMSODRAFT_967296 [Armillaria solidipes]